MRNLGRVLERSSPVPPGQGGKGSYSGRQTSAGCGRAQKSGFSGLPGRVCGGLRADLLLMRQTAAAVLASCVCES